MEKEDLEKRIEALIERRITNNNGKSIGMRWKAIGWLDKSETPCCKNAYRITINYLIKRGVLSYSAEGNYGLFSVHDVCKVNFNPADDSKKTLYFTREKDAEQYNNIKYHRVAFSHIVRKMTKEMKDS